MQTRKVKEKGIRRTVWLPNTLDTKAEEVRKQLGLEKSAFYRFAITELVKDFALPKGGYSSK